MWVDLLGGSAGVLPVAVEALCVTSKSAPPCGPLLLVERPVAAPRSALGVSPPPKKTFFLCVPRLARQRVGGSEAGLCPAPFLFLAAAPKTGSSVHGHRLR